MADFEENFFRVKKYAISNFFICQYIGIEGIDKIKRILCCIFEKNDLKKWDFFIIDKTCISGYKSWSRAGL